MYFHAEVGLAWDFDGGPCIGAFAMFCTKLSKVEGFVTPRVAITNTWTFLKQHSDTTTVTLTYDYATSDDSSLAGNKSDMFLTPALNVKFSKSALIAFSASTCAGTSQEVTTWNLASDSNVPVCYLYMFCLLLSNHVR